MPPSDFDPELQELRQKSVHRLLAAEVFDPKAFQELKAYLCVKSEAIKHEHVVSKQVLSVILDAANSIESRAEYIPKIKQRKRLAIPS